MAIGEFEGSEALYVADAKSKDSSISVYGKCDGRTGQRQFIKLLSSTDRNQGIDHTYGICFDREGKENHPVLRKYEFYIDYLLGIGNIYTSNQHSDCVIRFEKDKFNTMPLPPALKEEGKGWMFYPGTFVQFGGPGQHLEGEQGIRSIALVNDDIWIANEDIKGVAIVDIATGITSNIVVIPNPIGIHYSKHHKLVFISSKAKHWQGAVYAVDPDRLRVVKKFTTNRMDHPTGVTVHEDVLFVAEQVLGEIYSFDVKTGAFLSTVVRRMAREVEQVILSDC